MTARAFLVLAAVCAACGLFAADTDFDMTIVPATSSIFGAPNGTASGSVPLVVQLDSRIAEVQGWSFGVKVAPEAGFNMNISALKVSNSVLTSLNGQKPGFDNTSFFAAGNLQSAVDKANENTGLATISIPDCVAVTQGIVIDFMSVVSLPIVDDFGLIEITVNASGPIGTEQKKAGSVVFTDEVGNPPTPTVVVYGGASLTPVLKSPAVIDAVPVSCIGAAAFTINIDDASGMGEVQSIVRLNFNADDSITNPIQGWSYGICVLDTAKLAITAASTAGTDTATVKNGGKADFDQVTPFPTEGGVTHGVVIDFAAAATIPATKDWSDLALTCSLLTTTAGDTATIAPCSAVLGTPATPNVMVVEGMSLDASTYENPSQEVCAGVVANHLGVFTVADQKKSFLPGNANGDKRIDIADGIFLLSYLFRGGRVPPCMAAADFNNDGVIDVTDAIAVIYYQLQPVTNDTPPTGWPSAALGGCGQFDVDVSCEIQQSCN